MPITLDLLLDIVCKPPPSSSSLYIFFFPSTISKAPTQREGDRNLGRHRFSSFNCSSSSFINKRKRDIRKRTPQKKEKEREREKRDLSWSTQEEIFLNCWKAWITLHPVFISSKEMRCTSRIPSPCFNNSSSSSRQFKICSSWVLLWVWKIATRLLRFQQPNAGTWVHQCPSMRTLTMILATTRRERSSTGM